LTKRAIIIVMDSVGIGELPDASDYGDKGSNTLGNISLQIRGLQLPNLQKLGLGNIAKIPYFPEVMEPEANYGKMAEMSKGKDTTTGHWEMAGIIVKKKFPTFSEGFPADFISKFEEKIGRKVIGNIVASGTEIIQLLGSEHIKTGSPIVYTSADSVLQIAAHEEVVPLDELMDICKKARKMLVGDLQVSRVIARPFLGEEGNFYRTTNRHDFSIEPTEKTVLDRIIESGKSVLAVGKINDIYAGKGITEYLLSKGNMDGIDKTLQYLARDDEGLIMSNLVDFDMLFGHRNNVEGYALALQEFDSRLPEILAALKDEDLLMITADHGCDPTTVSTDHSREYVPLLVYGKRLKKGVNLGVRSTFADIGATIAQYLGIDSLPNGISFLQEIKEEY